MKKRNYVISAPARLSVAMPLIVGLATIAVAPTVEAAVIEQVDIINGFVDVNESGGVNAADNATNVLLNCNDATSIQADIIGGAIDVNENGAIASSDDAFNCDMNDLVGEFPSTPSTLEVNIINGCVDVDKNGICPGNPDDATNVRFILLP
jgi:hypothetical protein